MGWWRSGWVGWAVVCVGMMLASPRGAHAQDETVVVSGVIRDSGTNAPVSGVMVRILERSIQVITGLDDRFVFATVPPGTYRQRASCRLTSTSSTCTMGPI